MSADVGGSFRYHLRYAVTGQRFIGAYEKESLMAGDSVVVAIPFGGMTGLDVVEVVRVCFCNGDVSKDVQIIRKATSEELESVAKSLIHDSEYTTKVAQIADEVGVKMRVVKAHMMPFSKTLVIFFSSSGRVDFRPLLAPLGKEFKASVNLQQLSFRAQARASNAFGVCGRPLCCRSVLNLTDRIRISPKKVKEQSETLNFLKTQGSCGKLFCCFAYEDDFYKERKRSFPSKGDRIVSASGESFKVRSMNYISGVIKAESDDRAVRSFKYDEIERGESGVWKALSKASGEG